MAETQVKAKQSFEPEPTNKASNEIHVSYTGSIRAYVEKAIDILKTKEKSIKLSSPIKAIPVAVSVCEIVKNQNPELHQLTTFSVNTEESHDSASARKEVFTILLTLDPSQIDQSAPGYQKPLEKPYEFHIKNFAETLYNDQSQKPINQRYSRWSRNRGSAPEDAPQRSGGEQRFRRRGRGRFARGGYAGGRRAQQAPPPQQETVVS